MKYIKKNHKEDEKKVMSTRVRSIVFDAFQNASEAANDYGYNISLSNVVETALKETIAELAEVCGIDYLDEEYKKLQKGWDKAFEKEMDQYKKESKKGRIIMEINQCMKLFKDSQIFNEKEISEIKPGVESYMGVLYSDKYKGGRDGHIAYLTALHEAELQGDSLPEHSVWLKNYIKDIDDYVDANLENDLDENALTAKKYIDQLSTKTFPGSNKSSNKKEKL